MKKTFLFIMAVIFSLSSIAQGKGNEKGKNKQNPSVTQSENKDKSQGHESADDQDDDKTGKGKSKDKFKNEKDKSKEENDKLNEHDKKVWDGIGDNKGSCSKLSKNQPAKVRESFQRDYPGAINVRWTKCRGDWTATFRNRLFMSTAVYHANGDRRDTRTPITRNELPRNVFDSVFKRRPENRLDDVIKIEIPNKVKEIFRVKNIVEGKAEYLYFNSEGVPVKYEY